MRRRRWATIIALLLAVAAFAFGAATWNAIDPDARSVASARR